MPKIRIFECTESYVDYDYQSTAFSGVTDWEEVSEKTYTELSEWIMRKNRRKGGTRNSGSPYLILINQPEYDIPSCIEDYKQMMIKEKVTNKKRSEAIKKRKTEKVKKDLEKEKKLYEELKGKFNGA